MNLPVKITLLDEVNCRIESATPQVQKMAMEKVKVFIPHARYQQSYRIGAWDGYIRYMKANGCTYINLLDEILPVFQATNTPIILNDLRQSKGKRFTFDDIDENYFSHIKWPEGHRLAGQPVHLEEHQVEGINAALHKTNGVLELATSFGKTLAMSVLCDQVNKKYGRCVVVVPSTDLVIQTAAEMRSMGLEVGEVRAGMKEFDKKNVVATWQSIMHTEARSKGQTLAGKEIEKEVEWLNQHELQLLVQDLACVICDECQILAGQEAFNQFTDLFKNIPIRWGLTGTVPKDRYENIKLKIALGNIILRIGASRLQAAGFLAKSKIIVYRIEDDFQTPVIELTSGAASAWQIEKDHLATFEPRLRYIAQELIKIGQNGNTLALVSSISTGKLLSKMIKEEDVDCEFLSGSDSANKRKREYDKINKSNNKILIATKQIAAVGLNIPRLFNIVFIDLGNSYVKTIQAVGRGLRKSYDKDAVTIYDFSSTTRISKKHCAARVKMFKNEGHEVQIIDVPKPW